MLAGAEGIAIFPNMIKGGFILGVNYGKGVLHVRNPDRTWSPPVMATMGGGSLGFQAGVQAADIILGVQDAAKPQWPVEWAEGHARRSMRRLPPGPSAGRPTRAQTPASAQKSHSYARSRGLFLGVSLGGSDISIDNNANSMLYGRFGVTPADVFQNRGLAIRPEVQAPVNDLNARSQAIDGAGRPADGGARVGAREAGQQPLPVAPACAGVVESAAAGRRSDRVGR